MKSKRVQNGLTGVAVLAAVLAGALTGAAQAPPAPPLAGPAAGQGPEKILDGREVLLVVHGYSTSYVWPGLLQAKLDRFFQEKGLGESPVRVESAVRGGTPVADWIDVDTGKPKSPWAEITTPKLKSESPVVVLCQQSLQRTYGASAVGIRGPFDEERIARGVDAMEKYVKLLQRDGADLVFYAYHIYKHPMEPAIGNERYALEALLKKNIPGFVAGPDVWAATKALYPEAFTKDRLHPNELGSEVMAQLWFEALLGFDSLPVPSWSRQQLAQAQAGER